VFLLHTDYIENPVALKGADVFGHTFKDNYPVLHEKILVSVSCAMLLIKNLL